MKTSTHHRIPLFDARMLHGLDTSASNFRAEGHFISILFRSIGGTAATIRETKSPCCKRGTLLCSMCNTLGAKIDFKSLTQFASGLKSELLPVQKLSCIVCLVRRKFHASRGVTHARTVSTIRSASKERCTPFL